MKYPKILNNSFTALKGLNNQTIVLHIRNTVANGQTIDMLVGSVAKALLDEDCIRLVNTGSYNFKKALLIRIKIVVDALKFDFEKTTTTAIDKNGTMYTHTVKSIVGEREKLDQFQIWFNDAKEYQDSITLKGSRKVIDNNSTELLQAKSEVLLRVKEINPDYLDLYATLLYEANKSKVNEENYFGRLQEIADETKAFMGYTYVNYRKLDSNSRNYPLNRYGFAVEYGDSFEKFMIEPEQQYLVTDEEVGGAIAYLESEFKTTDHKKLVYDAIVKLDTNLSQLHKYTKGVNVEFTITHKELGKLLHIVDVYHNIINNLGQMTRSCVSYDFVNSGGINASNQFGDEKFLRTMNLLGDTEKFDTHQRVADHLGMERNDAKGIMQGPNHGGQVIPEHKEMVEDIFGPTYKYIRMIAEYGKLLASKGVEYVELVRPDGVKAIWYPYTIDCDVSMEDGSSVSAIMPYGGNGTDKNLGLAVSILHSGDAFIEAHIQKEFKKLNIHNKTTLDNFYGRPSIKDRLVEFTFDGLNILNGYAERQLQSIEQQTGIMRGFTLPKRTIELVPSSNII